MLYCLITAALRSEIDVSLPCAMNNHYHALIYDRAGRPGSPRPARRRRQVGQDLDLADHPADPQQQIAARSPPLLIAHNDAHTMPRMAHRHCALLAAVALSGACATTGGKITVDVQ